MTIGSNLKTATSRTLLIAALASGAYATSRGCDRVNERRLGNNERDEISLNQLEDSVGYGSNIQSELRKLLDEGDTVYVDDETTGNSYRLDVTKTEEMDFDQRGYAYLVTCDVYRGNGMLGTKLGTKEFRITPGTDHESIIESIKNYFHTE